MWTVVVDIHVMYEKEGHESYTIECKTEEEARKAREDIQKLELEGLTDILICGPTEEYYYDNDKERYFIRRKGEGHIQGPYGGAFADSNDYWNWRLGRGFFKN